MLILGFSIYMSIFSGCGSDSDDIVDPVPPSLDQLNIICHDLAPAPGTTAQLTIQVDGYSPSGEWPVYTWTSDAGTFPDGNTGISVAWTAPVTPGLVSFTVTGVLGGLADTTSTHVLVRNFGELDTGRNFSCHPRHLFNELYYFGDADGIPPRSPNFLGYHCYRYVSSDLSMLVTNVDEVQGGGYNLYMPEGGSVVVGSFIRTYFNGLKQQRQDTWLFPLTIGSIVNVTDDGGGIIPRMNQHVHPFSNPYGGKVVWEARVAGPFADGTWDLSNVGYWESFANDTVYVTESHDSTIVQQGPDIVTVHRFYNNIKPMITPDEDKLIYFVDTTGVFEPCIIDMSSGLDISSRRALMVTDRRGIFETAGINVYENTVFQWNHTAGIMAFIERSGKLCFFDPLTESVMTVPGLDDKDADALEVVWSPDGIECAVVRAEGIWLVSVAGIMSADPVFRKEKNTDGIIGLAWSPNTDEPKLAFRMIRKGKNVEDSFSALMISYLNDELTVYASPSVHWNTPYEPMIDYTYLRLFFDGDENIYAPIPTPQWSGDPDRDVECAIFYCY